MTDLNPICSGAGMGCSPLPRHTAMGWPGLPWPRLGSASAAPLPTFPSTDQQDHGAAPAHPAGTGHATTSGATKTLPGKRQHTRAESHPCTSDAAQHQVPGTLGCRHPASPCQDSACEALNFCFDIFNQGRRSISASAHLCLPNSKDTGKEERAGASQSAKFTQSAKAGAVEMIAVYKYLQRQ